MKIPCLVALTVALGIVSSARADISVTDDTGRIVRLATPAKRIVALAPHIAESLFAVGAGRQLIGTVDFSDFPPEAKQVPRVGGYSRIDLEAVAALKPDLVIAWDSGNPAPQVSKLRELGLTVFVSQPNKMDDIATQLEQYGRLAGTEATARRTAEGFRQRLAALRRENAGKPAVRTFYQIWTTPLMTVGGQQIITDAIALCGGENVFGKLPTMAPAISIEAVLAADPEVIIASGMGDARPEWLDDWARWPRLKAVQRGNLFHINPDLMNRHTPRLLEGTSRLCKLLDQARARTGSPR